MPATLTLTRSTAEGALEVACGVDAQSDPAVTRPFAPFDFALDGKDFEPLSGRVTFNAGERIAYELKDWLATSPIWKPTA